MGYTSSEISLFHAVQHLQRKRINDPRNSPEGILAVTFNRKMSRTSNSLEKVLVLWSSMTCFTNCFTVSGSWPSGTQEQTGPFSLLMKPLKNYSM